MSKIYSIIVAYNASPEQMGKAIAHLEKQVDHIIVCNNGMVRYPQGKNNVQIINFFENLGIAAAQSIGMRRAFDQGADFVLQMDQDSVPSNDMVPRLLSSFRKAEASGLRVGLVGAQDFDNSTGELNNIRYKKGLHIQELDECFLVKDTLSSGSLISREAYECVGGMDDDLFIDAVDFEYCWRLRQAGFVILRDRRALLGHSLGEGVKKIAGAIPVRIPSPSRHYYAYRNALLLFRRGYTPLHWKLTTTLKNLIKLGTHPFLLDNGKDRLIYMLKGIKDGLLGRSGRIDGKDINTLLKQLSIAVNDDRQCEQENPVQDESKDVKEEISAAS